MEEIKRRTNRKTRLIEQLLGRDFPNTTAYQYNPASIRVRVVDERFQGQSKVKRHDMVSPLLKQLPEDVQIDITILLLLAPEETEHSMMNLEFERPTPSVL
jgi:acid stress-induced BolA-like protein IbaG/YrbA